MTKLHIERALSNPAAEVASLIKTLRSRCAQLMGRPYVDFPMGGGAANSFQQVRPITRNGAGIGPISFLGDFSRRSSDKFANSRVLPYPEYSFWQGKASWAMRETGSRHRSTTLYKGAAASTGSRCGDR